MKMRFRIGIGVCCVMLMISLVGCQLALEESGFSQREFVGIFVTTKHIEALVRQHENQEGNALLWTASGHLAGRIAADDSFDFGVPGFSLFIEHSRQEGELLPLGTTLHYVDEAIGEIHSGIHHDIDDWSESISTSIEGSLFLTPEFLLNAEDEDLGLHVFYMHPVYRRGDGSIYLEAVSGMGIEFSDWDHEIERERRWSMGVEESFTRTIRGREETHTISATLHMILMHSSESLVIYQMNEGGELLSRTALALDEMPEDFIPEEETAFIVVETWGSEGENNVVVSRSVYGREAEEIESFRTRADGVNVIQRTNIVW